MFPTTLPEAPLAPPVPEPGGPQILDLLPEVPHLREVVGELLVPAQRPLRVEPLAAPGAEQLAAELDPDPRQAPVPALRPFRGPLDLVRLRR